MEQIKVSVHVAAATNTQAHNDRTLYDKELNEFSQYRALNLHSDYNETEFAPLSEIKQSEYQSEINFYKNHFSKTLEIQNKRAMNMRKYERVMTMEEWHDKHPPKEVIIGLGDKNFMDELRQNGEQDLAEAQNTLVDMCRSYQDEVERCGGTILSWDIHFDELGHPHAHGRFLGVTQDEKINWNQTLKEHNVELPPLPKGCEKEEDLKRSQTRFCNRNMTFTDNARNAVEDTAQAHGYSIDRERSDRKFNLTVKQYKDKIRGAEKEVAEMDESLKEKRAELAQAEDRLERLRQKEQSLEDENERIEDEIGECGEKERLFEDVNKGLGDTDRFLAARLRGFRETNRELADAKKQLVSEVKELEQGNRELADTKEQLVGEVRGLEEANRGLAERVRQLKETVSQWREWVFNRLETVKSSLEEKLKHIADEPPLTSSTRAQHDERVVYDDDEEEFEPLEVEDRQPQGYEEPQIAGFSYDFGEWEDDGGEDEGQDEGQFMMP